MTVTPPPKEQIEVQVMGQTYVLSCPENGQDILLQAVHKVDAAMCRIRDAGKIKARDRIAVLASLNIAFELLQVMNPLPDQSAGNTRTDPSIGNPASTSSDGKRLQDLIERIDQTLKTDSHLI